MFNIKIQTTALVVLLLCIACGEGNDTSQIRSESFGLLNGSYALDASGEIDFQGDYSGENYNEIVENPFIDVSENPVSTFSIDADGASYTNVRRFVNAGMKPPSGAIRTEELINYFPMDYLDSAEPISVDGEVTTSPWTPGNFLIRIGIKGRELTVQEMPPTNFVFLIDVSGSMSGDLPLLQDGFSRFTDNLRDEDVISIVTYAGSSGVLLEGEKGRNKEAIKNAINSLSSGGSTAGAEGIVTAYRIARDYFIEGGNNRVILGTDGDFNVGPSSQEELIDLIESKRDEGIFLTVVGVGYGNLNEGTMEQIANHGNGNFEYIDQAAELDKIFVHEFPKFYTVAKDVKVQVKFNPMTVSAYRLIGYENRLLEEEDFDDDTKDAGEIGAGQSITALYEIVPAAGYTSNLRTESFYNIDFRYKEPDSDVSKMISLDVFYEGKTFTQASENIRFAACLATYGMLLRDSEYLGDITYADLEQWLESARVFDPYGYRVEFSKLVQRAKGLSM